MLSAIPNSVFVAPISPEILLVVYFALISVIAILSIVKPDINNSIFDVKDTASVFRGKSVLTPLLRS
jgi:hypothetical protein